MRSRSTITLSVMLGAWLCGSPIWAQDLGWRPNRYSSRSVESRRPIAATPAPVVTLGAPIAKRQPTAPLKHVTHASPPTRSEKSGSGWGLPRGAAPKWYAKHDPQPTKAQPSLEGLQSPTTPLLLATALGLPIVRAQAPDTVPAPILGFSDVPPPPPVGSAEPDPLIGPEPFNNGAVPSFDQPPPASGGFRDRMYNYFIKPVNANRGVLESDNYFNMFSSPITSPFLSEDPRSLTEVRPIFIYQDIPNKNSTFQGGDVLYYGLQARVAINERFSVVLNKLGGISFDPENKTTSGFGDDSSFAEVWLGPKVTVVRNEQSMTLVALGATFQIPVGSAEVAQDTGSLSISPYVSFAQGLNLFESGPINFMTTIGYSFSTNSARSEYFYANFHLDYNILGKVFPTLEVNWTHYTSNGDVRPFSFEGGDLINFGSQADSDDLISIAPGVRYKFSECVQAGAALEFPVTGDDEFNDFRLVFDFIFRY